MERRTHVWYTTFDIFNGDLTMQEREVLPQPSQEPAPELEQVGENEYPVERPFELAAGIDQLMSVLIQMSALTENPIHFVWQGDIFSITDNGLVSPKDGTPDGNTDFRLTDLQEAADKIWKK